MGHLRAEAVGQGFYGCLSDVESEAVVWTTREDSIDRRREVVSLDPFFVLAIARFWGLLISLSPCGEE